MKKRDFIRKSLAGFGGIVALPIAGCETKGNQLDGNNENCEISPRETRGPFPNKTPAELMRANIIGDRKGVALLINLKVQSQSESCGNLSGVQVDVWHCDAEGYYSEYGGNRLQQKDLSNEHFLRGRQTTNENGEVSFISIFPGWYPGRAPHIHLDVVKDGDIILTTQIAFPEAITSEVYASSGYKGKEDTPNEKDGVFRGSLAGNMADSVGGNLQDGYTLSKVITVA
ncbi:intradiol ring-cleavage dioxygenase [Algoriphagus zhangzhouensis]|uniref:Dioxygenase n=1 Tax=Algoriphagus zhangzhouensis TaxID=1073327 RepID=A0A1M7ZE12_9BACT|nr:intradiol ring-cleavage dioxygenase [Algoriphagus zhangzhouensis]TDY45933.1 dioxygenase-like protein [Algoriphagus zhangzhouensis]SHO63117.1 Dioxygenase [Algoriphagus zhangzhouensis]